jgi:hypothetical protein
MKTIAVFLCSVVLLGSASAQSIVLGAIQTKFCSDKDTLFVSYQASGAFHLGNVFKLHLSDATGSFANFQLIGSNDSMKGTIAVPVARFGENSRVLIASSDPYVTSDTSHTIRVVSGPKPAFWATRALTGQRFGNCWVGQEFQGSNPNNATSAAIGFAGETWTFAPPPFDNELPETNFELHFPADANILSRFDSTATVSFATPGYKTVSIDASSPDGCPGGSSWTFYVASQHPTIPRYARVITADMGNVTGDALDTVVWVKSGASYTRVQWFKLGATYRIYAEPGSSISGSARGKPQQIYLRPGAVFPGYNSSISSFPQVIVEGYGDYGGIDTFYVPDLTFDYSQVSGDVEDSPSSAKFVLHQTPGHLLATSANQPIELRLLNLLGNEVLSRRGVGELDIDLTPVPDGIYIAIAKAGDCRKVHKIAVTH